MILRSERNQWVFLVTDFLADFLAADFLADFLAGVAWAEAWAGAAAAGAAAFLAGLLALTTFLAIFLEPVAFLVTLLATFLAPAGLALAIKGLSQCSRYHREKKVDGNKFPEDEQLSLPGVLPLIIWNKFSQSRCLKRYEQGECETHCLDLNRKHSLVQEHSS